MNCKKMALLISEYIDNELSQQERMLLESHLETCVECKIKLARLKKNDDMISVNKTSVTTPFFETRLQSRLDNMQTEPRSIFDLAKIEKRLLAVFTALLLIVSVITLKSYYADTGNGYSDLISYVSGASTDASTDAAVNTVAGLLDKQNIELDDMVKYITSGE